VEGVGGRESACPEASVGDSGSWSAATEVEWAVVLRVGSIKQEGGGGVGQWCLPVNRGGGKE
jgi:hypothetical protein